MERVITTTRIILSLVAFPIYCVYALFSFFAESVVGIFWLIIVAIFASKEEAKESWLSRYPNTIRSVPAFWAF